MVDQVRQNVQAIRSVFPNVLIGDIEPVAIDVPGWADQIVQFAQRYAQVTGRNLDFFHADINWNDQTEYLAPLQEITAKMRGLGIKVGYIYNGDGTAITDTAWTDLAAARFTALELDPANIPDHAVLQTWMLRPAHMLPETNNGTMTFLVNRYTRLPVTLALTAIGNPITGRLLSVLDGSGVGGATVRVTALDNGLPTARLLARSLSGTVPAQAVTAVPVLRINTEGAGPGPADITIGTVSVEQAKETVARRFTQARYVVTRDQAVSTNASPFPVVGGTSFTFSVKIRTPYSSQNNGYVGIVFQDANQNEISRAKILFQAATVWSKNGLTDNSGILRVVPPISSHRAIVYRLDFAGDPRCRPVSLLDASVPQ
jgi:hypothetical protein